MHQLPRFFLYRLLCISVAFPISHIVWGAGGEKYVHFEHISMDHGLSQSDITATVQDHTGFLWFGTNNGLNRYDGYRFVTYKHFPGGNSLSGNVVFSLCTDDNGQLWIGTKDGIDRYDPYTDHFRAYKEISDNEGNKVPAIRTTALHKTREGQIWAVINNRLCRYDGDSDSFIFYSVEDQESGIRPGTISDIIDGGQDYIYLSTGKGLYAFEKQGYGCNRIYTSAGSGKVSRALASRDGKRLFAGTDTGLFVLDRSGNVLSEIRHEGKSVKEVLCLLEDSRGHLWAGTRENGVFVYSPAGVESYTANPANPYGITSNEILSLFEDHSGVVWIGTASGGLNKFPLNQKPFINTRMIFPAGEHRGDYVVRAIYVEGEDTVWIGTKEGFLGRWNKQTGAMDYYKVRADASDQIGKNIRISAIEPKGKNELWIGTGKGLMVFDKNSGSFRRVQKYRAIQGISTLYTDNNGDLWVGTGNGIFVISGGEIARKYVQKKTIPIRFPIITCAPSIRTGRETCGSAPGTAA